MEFTVFYVTPSFTAVFTISCHWSLSAAWLIQSTVSHFNNILSTTHMINPVHKLAYLTIYLRVWITKPIVQAPLQMAIIFHQNYTVFLCSVVSDVFSSFSNKNLNKVAVLVPPCTLVRFGSGRFFSSALRPPLLRDDISISNSLVLTQNFPAWRLISTYVKTE
jgi:hypothetical protein